MINIFKCACGTHLVEISYENVTEWTHMKTKKKSKKNIPDLWIGIYDIYNPKTGRKYRKPKLIADTIFYGKTLGFVMKFLEDIVMQYIIRKK